MQVTYGNTTIIEDWFSIDVEFERLKVGEFFKHGGGLYMKLPQLMGSGENYPHSAVNSICLGDLTPYKFTDKVKVTPYQATINIKPIRKEE